MSSAPPDAARQRGARAPAGRPGVVRAWRRSPFGVRLALGYAVLFALSAAALLALAYAALDLVLVRQDAAYLRDQLGAVERVYAEGGLDGVRRYAAALHQDDRGEEVLIRIADAENAARLVVLPDAWERADLAVLDGPAGAPVPGEIVNERESQDLALLTRALPGGGRLQVGMSSDERDDTLEALPRVFPVVAVPLVLLALLGGWAMARRALRPVRRLVGALEAITETGDVRQRVKAPEAEGELADLFALFNRTLGRIEALVGQLRDTLDDLAHDLRTPLTAVRGTAELALSRDREPEAYRTALARVVEATEAAEDTLDTVMEVAEAEAGLALDLGPVRLDAVARDVADLYEIVASEKGVALALDAGDAGVLAGDGRRLRRALANLVDNAVKYTPLGGRVAVTTGRSEGEAWAAVSDTGVGIAPGDLPRVWDRLYRAEATRYERGLGLGLGLARAIAEAHGGSVEVESAAGEGSTFTLRLPLGPAADDPANLSDL